MAESGPEHLCLTFSTTADPSRAARLHSSACPLVAAARRSRMGRTKIVEDTPRDPDAVSATVKDLEEREYPVKRCKCAKHLPNARSRATPNGGYYVWVMGRGDEPLDEPPAGPHDLEVAKQMARIAAQKGVHDRAVSLGVDPLSKTFRIVRRYRSHTGERVI